MAARLLLAVFLLGTGQAVATAQRSFQETELNIAEVPGGLTIGDPLAVFAFVLRNVPARANLPDRELLLFPFRSQRRALRRQHPAGRG